MKPGYSITSAIPSGRPAANAAARVLDRARVASEAGYEYIETGDHHAVTGSGYLQSVPMAARLTGIIDGVAPLFLLPMYNPVLVAEYVGTLAALAPRCDVWCAIGRADQNEAMGIPAGERVPRFIEALEIMRRLWREDTVTFDGEFYAVEGVSINPKADPRVCIGGTAEGAVRRAGELGDAWVANAHVPAVDIADRIAWFTDAGGGDVIARRDALGLRDGGTARQRASELLADGYRGWPEDADWVLTGDAEDIESQLRRLADIGVDEVVVRPMSDRSAVETLRVVAEACANIA